MTTPALHALRSACPRGHITVRTQHPWVFHNSPDVDRAVTPTEFNYEEAFAHTMSLEHADIWDTRVPVIEKNLRLVGAPSTKSTPPLLHLTQAELDEGASWINRLGRVVAIHTASPFRTKMWPTEYWSAVVEHLSQLGLMVVQVGGQTDERIAYTIDWLGVDFRMMSAALRHCVAVICIDSAVQHAAAAVGSRALVLW